MPNGNDDKRPEATTDPELIEKYDKVYENENEFWSFIPLDERKAVLGTLQSWEGFEVLEIGCGSGDMSAMIAGAGAKNVFGIDMSITAIAKACEKYNLENLTFLKGDFKKFRQENSAVVPMDYDVVIMIGVLEHLKDPYKALSFIVQHIVKPGGILLTTSPNFINPRGYIWMVLQELAGWPMSLTDKHQIHPQDVTAFCEKSGYGCNIVSLDIDWAIGPRLIADFKKRLIAASPLPEEVAAEKIEGFLKWLEKSLKYEQPHNYSGANILYQIARPLDNTVQ